MTEIFLLLLSFTIATAQVVMKFAANASTKAGTFFAPEVLVLVGVSFAISCAGQLLWLYVLRTAPLSTSYFFLSLVFVLVPIAGWWLFSEQLKPLHLVSMALILSGIAVLGFIDPRA